MDTSLATQPHDGDMDVFPAIVHRYSNAVYGVAYNTLRDFHLAQDIAQEVFLKAYMNLGSLRHTEKVGGWLYSIAQRTCIDWLRSNKISSIPINIDSIAVPMDETRANLWDALNTLSNEARLVVILFYISGYTTKEVAGFLGITPEAVESRLRRAKKILKRELMDMVEDNLKENKLNDEFEQRVKALIERYSEMNAVGKRLEALSAAREALSLKPDDLNLKLMVAHSLSSCWSATDDRAFFHEAESAFLELVKVDSTAYHGLGYVYMHAKDYDKAIECFQHLMEYHPDGTVAMAQALQKKGDHEESAKLHESAAYRGLQQVCFGLRGVAVVSRKLGDRSMAYRYYNTLISILIAIGNEPDFQNTLWNAYVSLAVLQVEDGFTDEALSSLNCGLEAARRATVRCKSTLFARLFITTSRSAEGTDLDWFLDDLTSEQRFGRLKGYEALVKRTRAEAAALK